MLDVGGSTIIQHQLDNLRLCGIPDNRVTIVTGHNHAQFEHYLRGEGFGGDFVFNPWYQTTNMLVSLWLARPRGNTIVLYGDIVFDHSVLVDVLASRGSAVLAIDRDSELTPEDEKVRVEDGHVTDAGKELDPAESFGEFIGLARFDAQAMHILAEELDAVVRGGGMMDFLTVALVRAADRGVALATCLTEGRPWNDNDSLADLDRSREKIFPRILESQRARSAQEIPHS
jgi:choline kinase